MRKFLYKHHKLTVAMIHIFALLAAAVGFVLAIILSPGEDLNTEGAVSLISGVVLALVIEIVAYTVPPYKYGMKLLCDLGKLSRGRKSFSLGERMYKEEKLAEISHNLEKRGYTERITRGFDGFVGRWSRVSAVIGERNSSQYSRFSLNLYLYCVENLDTGVWQSIKDDLTDRLREDRGEQRDKKGGVGIVNSLCILADFIDSEVSWAARKTLSVKLSDSVTLTGIRVCVGAPGSDIYYLSSERDLESNSRTNKSLEIISTSVFGVGVGRLSKLGNGYTEEYLKLLEKAYTTSLSQLRSEALEKALSDEGEAEREWAEDPISSLKEGEMLRRGDSIFCVNQGILVTSWIMLPEDAEKSFEDDDTGDLEDMIGGLEEEECDSEEPVPTVPREYRGKIVLSTSEYGMTLPKGKLKKVSKKCCEAVFSAVRDYLLREGFEQVYYYNEKKKSVDET